MLEHSRLLWQCPAHAWLNPSCLHNFTFQSSVLGQPRVRPRRQALEQGLVSLSTAPCSKSVLQGSQTPPPSLCPGWLKYSFFFRNPFSLVIRGVKTLELRSWEKYGPGVSSTEGGGSRTDAGRRPSLCSQRLRSTKGPPHWNQAPGLSHGCRRGRGHVRRRLWETTNRSHRAPEGRCDVRECFAGLRKRAPRSGSRDDASFVPRANHVHDGLALSGPALRRHSACPGSVLRGTYVAVPSLGLGLGQRPTHASATLLPWDRRTRVVASALRGLSLFQRLLLGLNF